VETLRDLFVGAVGAELVRWRATRDGSITPRQESEFRSMVRRSLCQMARLKKEGRVFSWQRYRDEIQSDFVHASDGKRVEILFGHCRFQGMIQVLPSFSDLVQQFYFSGLPEWTELTVDRETFHKFAKALAGVLLEVIATETVAEEAAEEGEMLVMISDIFHIPIPQDSERLARWCMTHGSTHSQAATLLR
jgi:hypothetical protein